MSINIRLVLVGILLMSNLARGRFQPMRRDAEYSSLGFYEPGVFHLEIATREDLNDFNRLSADPIHASTVSTFLHEYVHFLQDATSTHGLLNFIGHIEYLKNAIKQVTDDTRAEFATPVNISNSFEYQTNNKLREIYYGDQRRDAKAIRYSEYRTELIEVNANGGQIIRVPKYKISYYDKGAQSNEVCHFGSFHIKEYMAHAIQNLFSPGTAHSEMPYVLVELIIKKEYPALAADPAFIVALCDAALMHCHPAHLFFNAVERMKEHHWTPAGIDSVYAFVFDGLDLDWRGHADTFQSLHKRTVATAANEFRDALKADVFKENVRWFEQVMAGALKLRTEHGGFFAKLVSSPGMLSQLFYEVFDEMGTPFMTNALFNGYFYPPKKLKAASIQPYLPWVFLSIRMTFRGGKKCLLHSFCQARPDKRVTDQNCENSPWERVRLPELCPYAQMWKTWGLTGKQPV